LALGLKPKAKSKPKENQEQKQHPPRRHGGTEKRQQEKQNQAIGLWLLAFGLKPKAKSKPKENQEQKHTHHGDTEARRNGNRKSKILFTAEDPPRRAFSAESAEGSQATGNRQQAIEKKQLVISS